MNPVLLQKQLKENASDLDEFYKELKTWSEDMKRKEESLKNSTNDCSNNKDNKLPTSNNKKRKTSSNEKNISSKTKPDQTRLKSKVSVTDYSAWEKFDADAECEKVDYDENEESELTDECDETVREQAFVEKEKGNKFVKNKKWDEAIECYTKAIDLYAFDPIFYANRALCFLKKENMEKAEADCTMSLKLDKKYVKAYQRRAAAREAQNKLQEAEADLMKVLELEPLNKESKKSLEDLRKKLQTCQKAVETVQRPVSKFTASRNQRKTISQPLYSQDNISKQPNISQQLKEDLSKSTTYWPSGSDNIILVKAVNKPVHLQSKKPLKRIEIQEVTDVKETTNEPKVQSFPKPDESHATLKTDDLKIIEHKMDESIKILEESKASKNYSNSYIANDEKQECLAPKNSVQFYAQWRHLKTLENRYMFLKLIKPEQLSHIFKESLDSDIFSQILEVLAKCYIKNGDKIFNFLLAITEIKRFSTFTMFMTNDDKKYLWKLFDYIKEYEHKPKEEVDQLIKKYEL